jgi:putative membrane protein
VRIIDDDQSSAAFTNQRYRIHQKQVLALFGGVLPFALVAEMSWWAVPIVVLVMFTLYGIDGIGSQLEDPFGHDRNDIRMDAIVEDIRSEIMVLLDEWKRVGDGGGEMFMGNPATPQRTEFGGRYRDGAQA